MLRYARAAATTTVGRDEATAERRRAPDGPLDERDRAGRGTRGARLARQPDRRGRGRARQRRDAAGPSSRPAPRPASTRPSSSATAATATAARACCGAVEQRQRRDRRRRRRARRARPAAGRRRADRPRRHGQQGPAGRQRPPRRLAGRGPRRRGRARAAALPLRRRTQRARAARADDERHQRRRARRQQRGPAGVHGDARRRAQLLGGAALGRRDLPRAQGACSHERGLSTAVGDEGGFAPEPGQQRGRHPGAGRGHREGRLHARARTSPSPSTRPPASCSRTAPTTWPARTGSSSPDEMVGFWTDLVDRYPIVSIEDGMAEDDWDGLGRAHRRRRRPGAAGRRRPLRHQHRAPGHGHRARAWPTACWSR